MDTKRARIVVAHRVPAHAPIRVSESNSVTLGDLEFIEENPA